MSVFWYKARNRWAVNYDEDGKQRRRLFLTQQEAQSFLEEHLQLQEGLKRYTLGELVIMFFKAHENYHHKTKQNIRSFLAGREKNGLHIEGFGEFLRDKYADSLNRQDLERLRFNLKSHKRSNVTCNKYQAYIRAILSWAVNHELIPFNPWRDFKRLPVKKNIITANIAHFKSIIKHSPEWLQWAFYTAYACSLRFGEVELFNLKWAAFNFRQGYVQLYQAKSGNLKRVFPPPEYMQAAALRYDEDVKNGVPFVCHRRGQKVFSYRRAWQKALKDAGLEGMNIRPYDIRHVSATEMLGKGVDPATVAAQLGHSSPATTMNFYAHTTAGNQKLAGKTLPSLEGEQE